MPLFKGCCLNSSGLDSLEHQELEEPDSKTWLELEAELRKLAKSLIQKDKVRKFFCARKLKTLADQFIWPEELQKDLYDLIDSLYDKDGGKQNIISRLNTLIEKNSFQTLPHPDYWAFEELSNKLDQFDKDLKEKTFSESYNRLNTFLDNYHWERELRVLIEDLKELTCNCDIQNQLQKIRKLVKAKRKLPSF